LTVFRRSMTIRKKHVRKAETRVEFTVKEVVIKKNYKSIKFRFKNCYANLPITRFNTLRPTSLFYVRIVGF
jgi:hypothetical protein